MERGINKDGVSAPQGPRPGKAPFNRAGSWRGGPPLVMTVCLLPALASGGTISGIVRNGTTGAPAPNHEVILLRPDLMREQARTKTDLRGGFALEAPATPQLLRVMHEGVSYDRPASAGDSLAVSIFDSAPQVSGVHGVIAIFRLDSRGARLHVSEMFDMENESQPPQTLAGGRTFEFHLPLAAEIDSVLVADPSDNADRIAPAAVPEEPGHYTLDFPLRPGHTRFAVNYDLPYPGRLSFQPRLAQAVQQLAVMFPSSMSFSSASDRFHPLFDEKWVKVQALSDLPAGEAPGFEISGHGVLPPLKDGLNMPRGEFLSRAPEGKGALGSRSLLTRWRVGGGLLLVVSLATLLWLWRVGRGEAG